MDSVKNDLSPERLTSVLRKTPGVPKKRSRTDAERNNESPDDGSVTANLVDKVENFCDAVENLPDEIFDDVSYNHRKSKSATIANIKMQYYIVDKKRKVTFEKLNLC